MSVTQLIDPGAPIGHVVWQTPLPGAPQPPSTYFLSTFIAVPPAPTCQPSQLTALYFPSTAVELTADFLILDRSSRPCALERSLTLSGVSSTGTAVTNPVSFPVNGTMILTSARGLHTGGSDSTLIAQLTMSADQTDCPPDDVTPASWRVALSTGGAFTFANESPSNTAVFSTCRGKITTLSGQGVLLFGTNPPPS